jgi:hypothetical protein
MLSLVVFPGLGGKPISRFFVGRLNANTFVRGAVFQPRSSMTGEGEAEGEAGG